MKVMLPGKLTISIEQELYDYVEGYIRHYTLSNRISGNPPMESIARHVVNTVVYNMAKEDRKCSS